MAEERVRVFANSFHYLRFENRDCCHCQKYSHDASECSIMAALAAAAVFDGTVSETIANRLRPTPASDGRCGEFVGTRE